MIFSLIIYYYAAGLAFIGLHCMLEGRLTLCQFLIIMLIGGIQFAIVALVVFGVIAAIYNYGIYLLGIIITAGIFQFIFTRIAKKLPIIDIRNFCVILWRKK